MTDYENYALPDEDDWFGTEEEDDDGTNYYDPGEGDMTVPDLDEPYELPKEVLKDNDVEKADG